MEKGNMHEGKDIDIILGEKKIENSIIREFEVNGEINNHKKLEMKIETDHIIKKEMEGIVSRETSEIIINLSGERGKEGEKNIFYGIIDYFEVLEYGNEGCIIILRAYSKSILFDRHDERKYRVFQDISITYEDIVEEINKDYREEKIQIRTFSRGKTPINSLIVQYNETDWEFLVRLASHLGTGILVTETGIITFGLIDTGNIKHESRYFSDYSIVRDLKKLYYKVYSNKVISTGDKVYLTKGGKDEGEEYTVLKSRIFLKNHILRSEFRATDIGNYKIFKKYNSRIRGSCIEGKVEKVLEEGDIAKMEVTFYEGMNKIAELKKSSGNSRAYPDYGIKRFPLSYQTFYSQTNTGFFCTPEVNDNVEVYFPDEDESMAKISWAVNNKGNGRFSNYERRNFHINGNDFSMVIEKNKMELSMEKSYSRNSKTSTETAESFINKGKRNMVIVSDDYLGMESVGEMDIYGNNINVRGKEKDITIETPGEIRIKGKKVHNN